MTTTKTMTDHERATQDVETWRANLEQARAELDKLDTFPSADAKKARELAANLFVAREYVTQCEHSLEAAHQRQQEAARAQVAAEAAGLQPEIDAARAELAEHDERVAALQEPLEKFTGQAWAAVDPVEEWRAAGGTGSVTVKVSVREKLAGALRSLERQQNSLRVCRRGWRPRERVWCR